MGAIGVVRMIAESISLHPENKGFRWEPVRGPFRLITEEQARSYNEGGFFVLEDALDRTSVDRVIAEIDPFEAKFEEALRKQPNGRAFIAHAHVITFTIHLVQRRRYRRHV